MKLRLIVTDMEWLIQGIIGIDFIARIIKTFQELKED